LLYIAIFVGGFYKKISNFTRIFTYVYTLNNKFIIAVILLAKIAVIFYVIYLNKFAFDM